MGSQPQLPWREELLRYTLDNAPHSAMILDCEGKIMYANRVLDGMNPDEVLGKKSIDLFPPAYREMLQENHKKILQTGESMAFEIVGAATGHTYKMDVGPIKHDGEVIALVAISRDITERKKMEEALRESEAKVLQLQKLEVVGRLAGGVVHDFNNLLTAILAHAEFGMQDSKTNGKFYDDFFEIEKAATQARALTLQLLSFSRNHRSKPTLLNLNETIDDLSRMLKRVIGEDIELKMELEQDLAPIQADPVQIQQVLMNLCINARDAMPNGGQLFIKTNNVVPGHGAPHQLQEPHSNKKVEVTITDTGIGMTEEVMERIFEPFYTTKEIGKGTGLGLSVVREIVEQYKGHIQLESKPNKGTVFKITLPASDASDKTGIKKQQLENIRGHGEKVLLVEDDKLVREVTHRILKELNYRVVIAKNGIEAMAIFESEAKKIDLALLDVVLPHASGPDIYKQLRAVRPELPILFVTGYEISSGIENLCQADHKNTMILPKPFTISLLGQKIRELLDE